MMHERIVEPSQEAPVLQNGKPTVAPLRNLPVIKGPAGAGAYRSDDLCDPGQPVRRGDPGAHSRLTGLAAVLRIVRCGDPGALGNWHAGDRA